MGRDKALLPFGAATLLQATAAKVFEAADHVALIADPISYSQFGFTVYPDRFPGCGPLGGLQTALQLHLADWSLIVACDMPHVSAMLLAALLDRAESLTGPERACIVPRAADGELEPLCAVYHSSCLSVVEEALREKRFKMKTLLSGLKTVAVDDWPPALFTNVNTPEEWAELERTMGQ